LVFLSTNTTKGREKKTNCCCAVTGKHKEREKGWASGNIKMGGIGSCGRKDDEDGNKAVWGGRRAVGEDAR
jgi:hypothetical protein